MTESNKTAAVPEKWYVLVAGLRLDDYEVNLGPGLTLRQLIQPISVFDLASAGAVGFREWAVLEPLIGSCFCEIESDNNAARIPGYDTLNRAWLASTLLILRKYSMHLPVACSSYSWRLIADSAKNSSHSLPPFKGTLLDYHLKILVEPNLSETTLIPEDAEWIFSHFESFNQIASNSPSFRLALEAAVDWRYAKEQRSAVARIWSGIEALFGISSELVYRISILSACLLEPRGMDVNKGLIR